MFTKGIGKIWIHQCHMHMFW